MKRIELQDISLVYSGHFSKGKVQALSHLSFSFFGPRINVLMGESGCGKTSLLRCIMGLERYEGEILADGKKVSSLSPSERNIGYVSQDIALYPQKNVFENLAFPLQVMHAPREEIRKRVFDISDELGIKPLLYCKPRQLSLGQNQRVALGKALIKNPDLYLFDEPFSNLDAQLRFSLRKELKELLERRRAFAIFVTHDAEEALMLGDHLYVMEKGALLEEGSGQEVYHSQNPAVKEYFKGVRS